MPAAVLAATRRAGRDLGPPALSQATCLGPAKRRGLLRALEPKSCQRITRFTALEALRMLYPLFRPLLFALDPEIAHELTLAGLDAAASLGVAQLAAPRAGVAGRGDG